MKNILLVSLLLLLTACGYTPPNNAEKNNPTKINSTEIQKNRTGVINTVVDGFDVKTLNLWTSTDSEREISTSIQNKTKVEILYETDDYYLVQPESSKTKGYCMKGFVEIDK